MFSDYLWFSTKFIRPTSPFISVIFGEIILHCLFKNVLPYSHVLLFLTQLLYISFILIASFWIYHHEFFKLKTLNLPYLWFNVFFFFRDIQWFQHYLLQIFFSSHWIALGPLTNINWSYMHRFSSGFTILFC